MILLELLGAVLIMVLAIGATLARTPAAAAFRQKAGLREWIRSEIFFWRRIGYDLVLALQVAADTGTNLSVPCCHCIAAQRDNYFLELERVFLELLGEELERAVRARP